MNKIRKFVTLTLASIGLIAALSSCNEAPDAVITDFTFRKAQNASITKDIHAASIDESSKTITVELPAALYSDYTARAALKATITTPAGVEITVADADYSINPVEITVVSDKNYATYTVNLVEEAKAAAKNTLFFTEYYCVPASDLSYKGNCNQYIEITNKSASAINLSKVQLTRNHWENGVRMPSMDQTVTLDGTLAAGGILVIYGNRSSLFTEGGKFVSDQKYNTIVSTNGVDGYVLSSGGNILDCLGPENGTGNGIAWGVGKIIQRKSLVTKFTRWNESEWLTYATSAGTIKPADTAGSETKESKDNDAAITYLALEDLDSIIYGIIDSSAKTILVNIPTTYGYVHKITASTNGQKVRYNGKDVVTGVTTIDFSKATVEKPAVLTVLANDGSTADYKLYANMLNYHFNNNPGGYYKLVEGKAADGDVVMLYYPASKYVVSKEANSSKLKAVDATYTEDGIQYESGMASFAVSVDENDRYVFTCGGKYLTCKKGGNGLSLEASPSDYSMWKVEDAGNGTYYIVSVGESGKALEYYSGFSTYGNYSGNKIYQFQFVKKN